MDENIEAKYECNSPGGRILRRLLQPTVGEISMTENTVEVSPCYLLSLTKKAFDTSGFDYGQLDECSGNGV
jgi:hypothetical protein